MNNQSKFSILIVDDERSNLDVLSRILKTDYRVIVAKNAEDALEIAEETVPDLILLDVMMPGKSGFEVILDLKESDITRNIPVIFITGLADTENEEKGFFLGAVDYITKPFKSTIVKARVKMHLTIVKQMRTIERLSMTDALTDLPNRRFFDNQIATEWQRAIRESKPLSLLMIDADNFKKYNDTYGHPQGDILLQTIAQVFQNTLKRGGDFVARIGGEEFVVILPDTDLSGALTIAEHIRANVASTEVPLFYDDTPTSVTVSIGVSSAQPEQHGVYSALVGMADEALYESKSSGRNKVCSKIVG